jgi:peptidoglycan/LPS O-acetylase OafA/YrhL
VTYRPDIDGLRAVAVLSVVLYHYGVAPFTGGYVGVDVFLVISGYLITSLIYGEMENGTFSVVTFYERRIRRIYPALFVVLLVTTALGVCLLLPTDLLRYGYSLVATTLFASNVEFWRESGYFDVTSELKPLLHTWSLAVEEQFYLAFPLLLFWLRRRGRRPILLTLTAIGALSFAIGVWTVKRQPAFAFFLAPTRVWELLVGGILALVRWPPSRRKLESEVMGVLGVALILGSACLYTRETPFPGVAAIAPCIGATCVIQAGSGELALPNRLLSSRPFVFTGLISYSLYLWHWPFFVFAHYYALSGLGWGARASAIAASFAAASVVWRFVERPFRRKGRLTERGSLFKAAAAAMAVTTVVGLGMWRRGGLPGRFSFAPDVTRILAVAREPFGPTPCAAGAQSVSGGRVCVLASDSRSEPSFVLWGDSLSYQLVPAIELIARERRRVGLSLERGGCPPLVGVERSDNPGCRAFNDAALEVALAPNVDEVILASRWALNSEGTRYGPEPGPSVILRDDRDGESGESPARNNHAVFARGLRNTIATLRAAGKKVVFVHSSPEIGWVVPETLAKILLTHSPLDITPSTSVYLMRQEFVFATAARMKDEFGIDVVSPDEVLCATGKCVLEMSGKVLYRDDHHLSAFGGMMLAPLLARVM